MSIIEQFLAAAAYRMLWHGTETCDPTIDLDEKQYIALCEVAALVTRDVVRRKAIEVWS